MARYDNPSSQSATGTPKYWDPPFGDRMELSGAFRLDAADGTSSGGGSTGGGDTGGGSGAVHILGFYPGRAGTDDAVKNALGQYAQMGSSYWQPSNYKNLSTLEATRMGRGMHSLHIIAAGKDLPEGGTAYGVANTGTETRDNVLSVINGNPNFVITDYLERSEAVAVAYPDVTMTVHPMGEMDVAVSQTTTARNNNSTAGSMNSLFAYYNDDLTDICTALGRYVNGFFDLCDELAPHCLRAVMMGGYNTTQNNSNRNKIYEQITNPPSFCITDAYQNAYQPSNTPVETWKGDLDMYRTATGTHYDHWVRWGKPPMALNETGISHTRKLADQSLQSVYTDAQMATWIEQMWEAQVELDLRHVIYFNSESGNNGMQAIISSGQGTYPRSVAAFSGELTEAKAALTA